MLTLLYHDILSTPANGWPVAYQQVSVSSFRQHVSRLREHLLHPVEVHEQLLKGQIPRGFLFTFDDGAAGILEAATILAEFGTAGVAFICPGALQHGLWFYQLADALVRSSAERLAYRELDLPLTSPLDKRRAYRILFNRLFDLPGKRRDAELAEILSLTQPKGDGPTPPLTTLDEAGLRRAAATGGMVFANHTWSHPNLTRLPSGELTCEIQDAQQWLEASGLPILPWFAFPVGAYNDQVVGITARICPLAFGAAAVETSPAVWPRAGLYASDANPIRFTIKTLGEGRLLQVYTRWRSRKTLWKAGRTRRGHWHTET